MKLKSKSGITLGSLGIYVLLFTTFTVFASIIMTNLNDNLFNRRGTAINYSNLNKLQNNIEYSSTESGDFTVDNVNNIIEFSNGDKYKYDSNQKVILKNNGVLCLNVDSFSFNVAEASRGKKIEIQVVFNKYLSVLDRKIVAYVGVN